MGVCTVRGCFVALIVVTIHCAASQTQEKKSKDYFCILKEQAFSKQPPVVCQPLEACDPAPLLNHYDNVQKECQVSSSKRRDDKAGFLFQLDYWHGDLLFLFDVLKNRTLEYATLFGDAERIGKVDEKTEFELKRKHFVYSIEAGRLQDALLVYLTMPTQMTPNEIVTVINGNPKVNEAVLLNFLYFVRAIPEEAQRLEFYKAFKPVLYKHNLHKTYMALLYSIEVFPSVEKTKDFQEYYTDVSTPVIVQFKELMFQNQYTKIFWFEKHFPDYFALVIPSLTVFSRNEWTKRLDQKQLYAQVNFLESLSHRITMYQRIIDNTIIHGIGKDSKTDKEAQEMLRSFANQVDKLESALDEANQCVIQVKNEDLQSLTDTMQTRLECGGLWNDLMVHFHYTRQNLTDCRARDGTVSRPEPSSTFCQILLDDTKRQVDQQHRKLGGEMDQKLQEIRRDVREHQSATAELQSNLTRMREERRKLHLELLLANIGVGDSGQALRYYQLVTNGTSGPSERLYKTIVQSVYREAMHQNQRVENLIEFIKRLSSSESKLKLYALLKAEILKRGKQLQHYVAAMLALDVRELLQGQSDNAKRQHEHLQKGIVESLEKRWKDQIVAGNYREVAAFAANQPKYFEKIQVNIPTVDSGSWPKINFDTLAAYANSLPFGEQRLAALEIILKQAYDRRRYNSYNYRVTAARHINICENFLKRQKRLNHKNNKKLKELKQKIKTFDGRNGYDFFLYISRRNGRI
ncbi:SG1B-like salivary protein [Anopheles sinensis]|uniref:SG1B-like salivary protein n=1 Tax=Anopheles sinensis TaxID=74873 RepID=A0A084VLI9_ANOSI|nr:SG1B-like salivary protein [Anopheles sinensis]